MIDKRIDELLNKSQTLSAAEEIEVFRYYQEHPSQELRNRIVMKNYGLIYKVCGIYNHCGCDVADLHQEAVFGLMTAVERFEIDKGTKFSTYAHVWINQAVRRYMANTGNMIRVPVHTYEKHLRVEAITKRFRAEIGREPTNEELAKEMEISIEELENLLIYCDVFNVSSLNTQVKGDEESTTELGDFLEDKGEKIEEIISKKIDMELLHQILKDALTEKEYSIISLRYGLDDGAPKTLEEVGGYLGVTRERIRQIEKKAFIKLKNSRKAKGLLDLKEYLY